MFPELETKSVSIIAQQHAAQMAISTMSLQIQPKVEAKAMGIQSLPQLMLPLHGQEQTTGQMPDF